MTCVCVCLTPSTRRNAKDAATHVVAEGIFKLLVGRRELRGPVDVGQRRRRQATEPERFALLDVFGRHAVVAGRREVDERVPFALERQRAVGLVPVE